jgi:hypothetical protein
MANNKLETGDEFEWQGCTRRIVRLLAVELTLEGVDDAICVPIDATRVEVFKDAETPLGKSDRAR